MKISLLHGPYRHRFWKEMINLCIFMILSQTLISCCLPQFLQLLILQLYFKSNDIYNEQWQNAWIIPAFWQVLSFSLLCVICALWAPSQNSMRYVMFLHIGLRFLTFSSPLPLTLAHCVILYLPQVCILRRRT